MVKYKAVQTFTSEELGHIEEGQVKDINVGKAEEINTHSVVHYGMPFLERVDEPKKAGKK